jgi:hypothetical protein
MTGRRPTISDAELCAQILLYRSPALTSAMLASEVGMSRQGVDRRLRAMHADEDLVETIKEESTRLWWLSKAGHAAARRELTPPES